MGYIVIIVMSLGALAAWTAASPRKPYIDRLAKTNARSAAFSRQCVSDPAWPAKERFSKDMAKLRRDNSRDYVA